MASRGWAILSFLKFLILLTGFLSGCTSVKVYSISSRDPNLTVLIHMEDEAFQRELAELYVYEVKGKCERFFHGFISLEEGSNSVTLPLDKDLIVSFVRANMTYGWSLTNEDSIRFRPKAGQQYQFRLRERNGSRELLFMTKAKGGEFHEFVGQALPVCE